MCLGNSLAIPNKLIVMSQLQYHIIQLIAMSQFILRWHSLNIQYYSLLLSFNLFLSQWIIFMVV